MNRGGPVNGAGGGAPLDLSPLLGVRGVHGAALCGPAGAVQAQVGAGPVDPGIVTAARAVLQSLQGATGASGWNDLLLDLGSGPVLLTAVGGSVLLTAFDEVPSLGRVRLGVRRVLSPRS